MSPGYLSKLQSLTLVRVLTVLLSVLLSWLAASLHELPNTDAYTYIRAAQAAHESGLAAAYTHHQWAHISVLMAGIHSLTGLSYFQAAALLNTAVFALLSLCFVDLVAAISPGKRTVWLAMAVILCYPHLNEFRPYIIRDIGLLAFSLLAILHLLHYNRSLRLRHGIIFVLACLAGALFRPEIILMIVIAPVSLLMNTALSENNRRRGFFRLQLLALLLVLISLSTLAILQFDMNRLLLAFVDIYQPFLANLRSLANPGPEFSSAVFGDYGAQYMRKYSGLFLLAGLISALLATILESLGLIVAPLLAYGYLKKLHRIDDNARHILLLWGTTAVVILFGFILLTRFTTTRYTLTLGLVLLVLVPFIVDRLWSMASARGRLQQFTVCLALALSYQFVDSYLSFGASKSHLEEASAWINSHTRASSPLLTNEIYLAYSSGRVSDYDLVRRDMEPQLLSQSRPGSIFALTPRRSFETLLQSEIDRGALRLLQRFPAERGADLLVLEKDF
jgi:hypothetical protein